MQDYTVNDIIIQWYDIIVDLTHLQIEMSTKWSPVWQLLELAVVSDIHWPQFHSNLKRVQSEEMHQILNWGKLEDVGDAKDTPHATNRKLAHVVFLPKYARMEEKNGVIWYCTISWNLINILQYRKTNVYVSVTQMQLYTNYMKPRTLKSHAQIFFIQIQQVDHCGEKMAVSPDNQCVEVMKRLWVSHNECSHWTGL